MFHAEGAHPPPRRETPATTAALFAFFIPAFAIVRWPAAARRIGALRPRPFRTIT